MELMQELTLKLAEARYKGHTFNCLPIKGEQPVLRVDVSDLDVMPLFVTITETQILCIAYLFKQDEISSDKQAELNSYLLDLNIPMPLSSFALVSDYYVVFGALAKQSSFETVQHELVTLARNAMDAMEALEPFLK